MKNDNNLIRLKSLSNFLSLVMEGPWKLCQPWISVPLCFHLNKIMSRWCTIESRSTELYISVVEPFYFTKVAAGLKVVSCIMHIHSMPLGHVNMGREALKIEHGLYYSSLNVSGWCAESLYCLKDIMTVRRFATVDEEMKPPTLFHGDNGSREYTRDWPGVSNMCMVSYRFCG